MHKSPVTTLSTLSDGTLVTGGYDGKVVYWSSDLDPIWECNLPDLVNAVSVSPDEQYVFVAAADKMVYALCVRTGFIEFELGPHLDDVNYVTCHPQGTHLITVADAKDGNARIWDLRSKQQVSVLKNESGGIFSVKFSPFASRFATTNGDGSVRIWDFDNETELRIIRTNSASEVVSWHPEKNCILTGELDGVISLWDIDTGNLLRQKKVANSTIRCLAHSQDGKRLMAGGYDGYLALLDGETWDVVGMLDSPFQWERAATFANDAIYVGAFGCKPVKYQCGPQGIFLQVTPSPVFGVNSISHSLDDSKTLYFAGDSGEVIKVIEGQRPVVLHRVDTIINALLLLPNCGLLVAADYKGRLTTIDVQDGTIIRSHAVQAGPINCLAYDSEKNIIISGGYDGKIRFWTIDLDSLDVIDAHDSPVKTVKYVYERNVLLSGSSNGSICILRNGKVSKRVLASGAEVINDIAVDVCGNRFMTASRDCRVRIWDIDTGEELPGPPIVHTKSVKAIDYHEATQTILSGSYDGTAIVWKRSLMGEWKWKKLTLHGKPGVSVAKIVSDGSLVTGGWDGNVRRWSPNGEHANTIGSNIHHC